LHFKRLQYILISGNESASPDFRRQECMGGIILGKLDRDHILSAAEEILNRIQHEGETCFLTAYQLACLMDEQYPTLKCDLPIGGKGEGGKHESGNSFAQHIAWYLAGDNRFEKQWFSIEGLDSFTFCGKSPSSKTPSMFRLRHDN